MNNKCKKPSCKIKIKILLIEWMETLIFKKKYNNIIIILLIKWKITWLFKEIRFKICKMN